MHQLICIFWTGLWTEIWTGVIADLIHHADSPECGQGIGYKVGSTDIFDPELVGLSFGHHIDYIVSLPPLQVI